MAKVEAKLEEEKSRVAERKIWLPSKLQGSQGDMKIHHNQNIGLSQKEENFETQEHSQPVLVDRPPYDWSHQSNHQARGERNEKNPPLPERDTRINRNPTLFEPSNHPGQSAIQDFLKQGAEEQPTPFLGNLSRFLQDIQPELNEANLTQRQMEEGGVVAEDCQEPGRVGRRSTREELILSASKLNCRGSQNYPKY